MSIPYNEEEEDEVGREGEEKQYNEEPPLSPRSSNSFSPPEQESYEDTSPRISSDSKSLVVELETSPENTPSHFPLSPSVAALSQAASVTRASDESMSPQTYLTRLSVASCSPLNSEFLEWDDHMATVDASAKRNFDTPTTWEKVKSTFSRVNSTSGRCSRTNSLVP